MIIEKVRWKNFLSYGNSWTELNLNQEKIIGIGGANGSGKSIIIDAIYFSVTGKIFRPKVKKSQICNSRNKKNCVVEIYISKNNDKYIVRRGVKPDIFEIIKNDKPLDEDSKSKDFQTILEQIFRFNPKSLKNTMFLSSMDYSPFIRMTAGDKRAYIEDILNLQIFSDMLNNVKIDLSLLKNEIQEHEVEFRLIETEIRTINEMNRKIEQEADTNKKEIKKSIIEINNKNEILKKQLIIAKEKYDINFKKYDENDRKYKSGISTYNVKKSKISGFINNNKLLKKRELSDIDKENTIKSFFEDTHICNTCRQEIDEGHKENIIKDILNRIEIIQDKIKSFDSENEKYSLKMDELNKTKVKIDKFGLKNDKYYDENVKLIQKHINSLDSGILTNETIIKTNEKELNKKTGIKKDTTKKEQKKDSINEKISKLNKKQEVMNISKKLLSDKGIKTYIIDKYIPVMNKYVNEFLDLMGASYRLKFDSEFQETIVLRGYEKLSYHSFSSGEKQRCDLALLFAFLKISKIKNSFDSNLLILDEVVDASLDDIGLRGVLNILENFKIKEKKTLLIISHRQDVKNMLDKMYIAKKKIFSELSLDI